MTHADPLSIKSTRLWQDYLELCKPKVVLLMLVTAWVGMLLASPPNQFPWQAFIVGTLGIAALAGAAGVCNHLLDHKIDLYMQRTQQRPIAQGRISLSQAGVFALLLGSMGMLILVFAINPLTAWLTLGTSLGYAVFYTLFLKHATPQNIVIGGITGATPPLLGWTAVTGHIDAPSLLLVLIIFTWTPPHFWALAIYRRHEYRRAKIPMLPITHGVAFTKLSILLYTLLMIASTLLPFVIGMSGITYLVSAILLGSAFLYFSCKMLMNSDTRYALQTFGFSILYLLALFISLLLDHYLTYFCRHSL